MATDNQPAFVPAYDTRTGQKIGAVPSHWVGEGSPFPHLSSTPEHVGADQPKMPQDTPKMAFATDPPPPPPTPDIPPQDPAGPDLTEEN